MTLPHMMNCRHVEEGWCLDCVGDMHKELEIAKLAEQRAMNEAERFFVENQDLKRQIEHRQFSDFLNSAADRVKSWPEWKKNILGSLPISGQQS